MGCFPCFGSEEVVNFHPPEEGDVKKEERPMVAPRIKTLSSGSDRFRSRSNLGAKKEALALKDGSGVTISAQTFTFRELAAATKNFRPACFLGEGGFGRVYKGHLESTGQIVAVKQLDKDGLQGNREFLVEVLMLSLLHHPNLVNLIGYCADGDQRLLVIHVIGNFNKSMQPKARPIFNDPKNLSKLADPRLQGRYPMRGLFQAVAVAFMCIQEEAAARPLIADVVTALSFLVNKPYDPHTSSHHSEERRSQGPRDEKMERENPENGCKWDAYVLEKDDSPSQIAGILKKKEFDRDREVSEAMMWGANWREKQRATNQENFD
ncbi:hypothetical protein M5K25_009279 [Dendrobium thyrsiflorum]|uniref:Protein kinase domain-containing protein n=1 Tax=Dendrobium thyrsiflorum TaxID=117978 RepID=A0ABD0V528_DENTH